jgi:translation elongation factor aEF-1 beta
MVGIAAMILKVMPVSVETDLSNLKIGIKKKLENEGAQNISFEIQEVAFGLKALMVKMAWPEDKDTDIAENKIKEINGVSSLSIVDYRRAFG